MKEMWDHGLKTIVVFHYKDEPNYVGFAAQDNL